MNKSTVWKLIPMMFSFFIMGFVDLVGIATNYMKVDFQLTESMAGLLPSMVFLWFLIFSIPTGILMNKIGRKNTVLLSLVITILALAIPFISYNYGMMLIFCCLLGIGNTLLQVSLNPLISSVVTGDKLASSLTFGQFLKAIASFSAPIIAVWAAMSLNDWKLLFPIFMVISILAVILLGITKVNEPDKSIKTSSFSDCFKLLGDQTILLCFIGILCTVGLDVGVNVMAPKLFIERLGWSIEKAGYATSVYFLFRTIGSFLGAFILAKFSSRIFYIISVACIFIALSLLFVAQNDAILYFDVAILYSAIAIIGFGNANLFSIFFSKALLNKPNHQNEVSGLMVMGISGGAIFPLLMGFAADALQSQNAAVMVLCFTALYFLVMIPKLKSTPSELK